MVAFVPRGGGTAFEPVERIYFPEDGLASTVITAGDERVEVSLFGRDGMSGISVVHGVNGSPMETFIQTPGSALVIGRAAFEAALAKSGTLKGLFLVASEVRTGQIAPSVLSNARHTVEQRLARWLLMCQDRLDADDLPLTHEFLALMLGVRRASVTTALHILEGAMIIRGRGLIQIRDREKLRDVAGDAYGLAEAEYERLIGCPI
jgi:CRP-like cAMP-binding protein